MLGPFFDRRRLTSDLTVSDDANTDGLFFTRPGVGYSPAVRRYRSMYR